MNNKNFKLGNILIKFTIVTVCRNSEKTIERTIKSVLNQTYKNVEYIIIDGLSTDATLNIISAYKTFVTKMISEKDKGIYDAMNKGIKNATGEVIAFLNSDDYYEDENVLQNIAQQFNTQNCDILYGDIVIKKNENIFRTWKSSVFKKSKLNFGWLPPHPSFFARKKMFDQLGYFSLDFKISSDCDLMLRFLKNSDENKVFYFQKIIVSMEAGGASNQNFKQIINANIEYMRALKNNHFILFFIAPFFKVFTKIFQLNFFSRLKNVFITKNR